MKHHKRFTALGILASVSVFASLAPAPKEVKHALERTAAAASPTQSVPNKSIAYVVAIPNAQCNVHPTGQTTPSGVAQSDDQGIVRFYAPPANWGTQLSVECSSGSNTVQKSVDLTESSAFQRPPGTTPAPTVRPPLTGDPTTYSQQWLVEHDYLMRPDPNKSPAVYAAWLNSVSKAHIIGHKEPIARFDDFNDNFQIQFKPNWAGAALNNGNQYLAVSGVFAVPPTYSTGGDTSGRSSVWVGLDGEGEPDVLQVGIEADYNQSYQPWIEYFPNNVINITTDANGNAFTVNQNDQLLVEVWAGNPFSLCTATTTASSPVWACGGIDDNTTNTSSGIWAAAQPTQNQGGIQVPIPFVGDFAEFIVERKCANNNVPCTSYSPLTNFQQIWINGLAQDSFGVYHDLASDFYIDNEIFTNHSIATCQDSDGVSTEVVTFVSAQ